VSEVVYTPYFDTQQDQPWLGPNWTNGLGAGSPDAKWEVRFNMNIVLLLDLSYLRIKKIFLSGINYREFIQKK
jgi:hypothetical protein